MKEEIKKALDQWELFQKESKEIGVFMDLKQVALARITLLGWCNSLNNQKLSPEQYAKRLERLNSFNKLLDDHEKQAEMIFSLKRKVIYLERFSDEVSWKQERALMQEWILNQAQQLENYEAILHDAGIIKVTDVKEK